MSASVVAHPLDCDVCGKRADVHRRGGWLAWYDLGHGTPVQVCALTCPGECARRVREGGCAGLRCSDGNLASLFGEGPFPGFLRLLKDYSWVSSAPAAQRLVSIVEAVS